MTDQQEELLLWVIGAVFSSGLACSYFLRPDYFPPDIQVVNSLVIGIKNQHVWFSIAGYGIPIGLLSFLAGLVFLVRGGADAKPLNPSSLYFLGSSLTAISTAIVIWASTPSQNSGNWVPFRPSPNKVEPGVIYHVDKDSITYSGDMVRLWLRVTFDKPQIMRNERYPECLNKTIVALFWKEDINCAARTLTMLGGQLLCEGNVLVDEPAQPETSPPFPPGVDMGDHFAYCKKWYQFWK